MTLRPIIEAFQRGYLSFLRRFRVSDQTFLLMVAVIVGVVVGSGTFLYANMLEFSHAFFWEILPGWIGHHKALVILTPFAGALLLYPFIKLFPKDAARDGVPAAMEAVALDNGRIRWSNSLLCMAMSAITLGSGGSAGSEGPIILIGSALASGVGQFLRVSGNRLRVITACGAAAGLASIFNAPIAGVLFALEVVMGEFNVQSFSPIVISSVIATAFSRAFLRHGVAMRVLPYTLFSPWEIGLYALMGAMAGVVSAGLIRAMQASEHFFSHRVRLPAALKPACGALVVGVLGSFCPQIFGFSYAPITAAIAGKFVFATLLLLLVLKIAATAFTLGSGGSGGVLCPSLFVGAVLGSGCGIVFKHFFPHITADPGGYGVVGMGAVLGAVVQSPMTAIIMIFELTSTYTVILPLMAACIMASLVQKSLISGSIYTLSLARRGVDINAGREMGILTNLKVSEVMDRHAAVVGEATPYEDVVRRCLTGACNYLYLVDKTNGLEGVISFSDLRESLLEDGLNGLVIAKDLANNDVVTVSPDESLASCLNKFSFIDIEQLPVVQNVNGKREVLGVITRSQLMNAYRQEMVKRALIRDRSSNLLKGNAGK
ncbi:MAG: chloride channel protein [Syntrophobacteraceae bacterium]|nr:chloride channel protein [Syntrophobacteraceae bacterium]